MDRKLKIYTDGACSGNPGAGGWAAILIYGDARKEISSFVPETTNNRMELTAVIKGLQAVTAAKVNIEIYSDSAYVINAINSGWLAGWNRNGWLTADKKDVKNADLWRELLELNQKYSPTYIKVKGHSDNPNNNRADELAVSEIKRNKRN